MTQYERIQTRRMRQRHNRKATYLSLTKHVKGNGKGTPREARGMQAAERSVKRMVGHALIILHRGEQYRRPRLLTRKDARHITDAWLILRPGRR